MKKISILIPCYNEALSLPLLYPEIISVAEQLNSYEWEFLFVDDGSSDTTISIIKELRMSDPRVSYVSLSRNFGKERAMLAGFDFVKGDCVIIIDADLQDPPSLIPAMISKWNEGYEDIYAKRKTRGEESWLRKQFSLLFYRVLQKSSKINVLENVGDFRLLDRRCIESLKHLRESERYTKGLFCWIGFKKCEIQFERNNRVAGKSTWNFWSLLELAIEGITSFTTAPLRLASYIGIIVSFSSFVYMIYVFIKTLIYGDDVQGFPTIIIIVLFLGGVQLLTLGVLGEYIGRIFNESKARPTYVASEYNDKKI